MSQVGDVPYLPNAKAGTFFARDNVSNFIDWCRNSLGIIECLLFETEDLIMRKNERHVILCLLEVARRGAKFGMLAPLLVQMERQIDREIAAENKAANGADNEESDDEYEEEPCLIYGPQPQIVTNDLKTLHELVSENVYDLVLLKLALSRERMLFSSLKKSKRDAKVDSLKKTKFLKKFLRQSQYQFFWIGFLSRHGFITIALRCFSIISR